MNSTVRSLLAIVVISLPTVALAQSTDADHCRALVAKYQQYLDMSSKKGQQPQGLDARMAEEKCKAGDPAGIPGLEKALRDAGYDMPSIASAPASKPDKAANCGVETWSTAKMAYVNTPCSP